MNLKYKYFIGTQVMFYEIEIVNEFIHSVYRACEDIENPENITVDMCFNISEFFEKVDEAQISKYDLIKRFRGYLKPLEDLGVNVSLEIYDDMAPKTMTDYRRDINHFSCQTHDYVIWGESDCLVPVQMFEILDGLMDYADSQKIYSYITTFAVRKMWDDSWKVLEHVDMTDKPYHGIAEKDEPELAKTMPYSIRYVMSQEEMEEINSKVEQPDVRMIDYPKFDGSCLVMTSNLLKTGCNIPPGFFGLAAEDTSMMLMCQKMLGSNYRQFVVKNILKVHNRNHSQKRRYILKDKVGDIFKSDESGNIKSGKGEWYTTLRDLNKENINRILNNGKILGYKDWEYYDKEKV